MYSTDVDETDIGDGLYILVECETRHASSNPYSSDTEFDELDKFRLLGDMFFKFGFSYPWASEHVPDPYPNCLQ